MLVAGLRLQRRTALLAHERAAHRVELRGVRGGLLVARIVEAELRRRAQLRLQLRRVEGLLLRNDRGDREVVLCGGAVAAAAVSDRVRQHDQRGGTGLLARGAQLDPDAVPVGEAADHEQAHALGDRGVHRRRVGQLVVDVGEVLGGEADALVVDLDHHAAVGQPGRGDPHLGLRRGERGGVLQQLGQQVHEVGDGLAVDLGLRHAGELDALVGLHLGGGGPQDVHQRDRLVPAAAGLLAGEDQEVLAVAAHTGREVVQPEQALQLVRVGLVVLQVGDEGQLALDERLVAAREVGEDRVDVAPQHGLLGREADRLAVHLVEGAGDLADLVLAGDRDRLDAGVHPARIGPGELVDERGQPLLGDREGGRAQLPHRAAHLAGHEPGQEEGGQQGDDHDRGVDDGVGPGAGRDVGGLGHGLVDELVLDRGVSVELRRGGRHPGLGGDPLRLELLGVLAQADLLGHAVVDRAVDGRRRHERHAGRVGLLLGGLERGGALGGLAGHDRLQPGGVGLRTTGDELTEGDLLQVVVRAEGLDLVVELAALLAGTHQKVRSDGALKRFCSLGQLDRVHGTAVAGDVPGAEAELVAELHERVLDLGVTLFGLHRVHGGGVRDLAQLRELGLLQLEQLETALQALLPGHVLDGRVELLRGRVGGGPGLGDALGVALVGQQRLSGEVTLVEQRLPVLGRRAHDQRGLLGVLGLLPGVERALHLEAAHDQADQHRDQEDRVQPGGHPPVARGETAGAATGRYPF